jgi:hypothetical protein
MLGEDPTIGALNLSSPSAFAGMGMAVVYASNAAERPIPMSFAVIPVIPLEAACTRPTLASCTEGDA